MAELKTRNDHRAWWETQSIVFPKQQWWHGLKHKGAWQRQWAMGWWQPIFATKIEVMSGIGGRLPGSGWKWLIFDGIQKVGQCKELPSEERVIKIMEKENSLCNKILNNLKWGSSCPWEHGIEHCCSKREKKKNWFESWSDFCVGG